MDSCLVTSLRTLVTPLQTLGLKVTPLQTLGLKDSCLVTRKGALTPTACDLLWYA